MYCPRCGEEIQEGDRFCAACGADLRARVRGPDAETVSLRERIGRLLGRDRRTRLLTAGTAAAIAVAIAAFILLPAAEESVPQDTYTLAADQICVKAKKEIAAAGRRSLAQGGARDPGRYAGELVPIIAEWRSTLGNLGAPPDRVDRAAELDTALRDVEVDTAALARLAREGGDKTVTERATRADEATGRVEEAIDNLGLQRCSKLAVGVGGPPVGR